MGRKVKQLKNYTSEQIESLLESDGKHKSGVKLHAVLQVSRGVSSRKLEKFYMVSFKQINNWVERLDAFGMAGLRIKQGRGGKAKLTVSEKEFLAGAVERSPEEFGYNTAIWTSAIIIDFLEVKFDVKYSQSGIYKLLHSLGFSFQKGRGFFPERDEKLREEAKLDIKKL